MLFFVPYLSYSQKNIQIEKLSINDAKELDFSPVYYKDGIVFCSSRENEQQKTKLGTKSTLTDIYYCKSTGENQFEPPTIFSDSLTSKEHDGPITFSDSGNIAYFSRNMETAITELEDSSSQIKLIGIYRTEKINGVWTNVTPFEHNNESYSNAQPSLSRDGKRLYFISDMPGGYGKADLYVCELENGKWGKPKNLGAGINTSESDVFPYLHENGRLYFASTGYNNGVGGLDIYYTYENNGVWEKPIALPAPINSEADDFGYISNQENTAGFFTSNRKTKNASDDIYSFKYPPPKLDKCVEQGGGDKCVVFYENGTELSDTIPLIYEWELGDGTKVRGQKEVEHCYADYGTYTVKLNIVDTIADMVLMNEATFDYVAAPLAGPFINVSDKVQANVVIVFDGLQSKIDIQPENYYWDFGDGTTATGERVKHLFVKEGTYNIKLGIIGKNAKGKTEKACVVLALKVKGNAEN
jgi:hypothetical protein